VLQTKSLQNSEGFSLVEVMVAFVILIVGLLGLLQAVNVALLHNLQNQVREEAVQIASSVLNEMRTSPFGTPATDAASYDIPSKIRGGNLKYAVKRTVANASTGTTITTHQYQVDVEWQLKGQTFTHSAVTVRSK
jgi:type IV pilus assembly protein PilV